MLLSFIFQNHRLRRPAGRTAQSTVTCPPHFLQLSTIHTSPPSTPFSDHDVPCVNPNVSQPASVALQTPLHPVKPRRSCLFTYVRSNIETKQRTSLTSASCCIQPTAIFRTYRLYIFHLSSYALYPLLFYHTIPYKHFFSLKMN